MSLPVRPTRHTRLVEPAERLVVALLLVPEEVSAALLLPPHGAQQVGQRRRPRMRELLLHVLEGRGLVLGLLGLLRFLLLGVLLLLLGRQVLVQHHRRRLLRHQVGVDQHHVRRLGRNALAHRRLLPQRLGRRARRLLGFALGRLGARRPLHRRRRYARGPRGLRALAVLLQRRSFIT